MRTMMPPKDQSTKPAMKMKLKQRVATIKPPLEKQIKAFVSARAKATEGSDNPSERNMKFFTEAQREFIRSRTASSPAEKSMVQKTFQEIRKRMSADATRTTAKMKQGK